MNKTTSFTNVITKPGSTQQTVNVSRDGEPFGQLWTWANTRTELHPWHAQPLDGLHKLFNSLPLAKEYMRNA